MGWSVAPHNTCEPRVAQKHWLNHAIWKLKAVSLGCPVTLSESNSAYLVQLKQKNQRRYCRAQVTRETYRRITKRQERPWVDNLGWLITQITWVIVSYQPSPRQRWALWDKQFTVVLIYWQENVAEVEFLSGYVALQPWIACALNNSLIQFQLSFQPNMNQETTIFSLIDYSY
jgi:hypothetical protein